LLEVEGVGHLPPPVLKAGDATVQRSPYTVSARSARSLRGGVYRWRRGRCHVYRHCHHYHWPQKRRGMDLCINTEVHGRGHSSLYHT